MTTAVEDIKSEALDKVKALLNRANGRRRQRTLSLATVLTLLRGVSGGDEWRSTHGGTVANAYNYPATTTVVVVARVNGMVYLGVEETSAMSTTPGRAWTQLQPWRKGEGPAGGPQRQAEKWSAWATLANEPDPNRRTVVALTDPEIDALLGEGDTGR